MRRERLQVDSQFLRRSVASSSLSSPVVFSMSVINDGTDAALDAVHGLEVAVGLRVKSVAATEVSAGVSRVTEDGKRHTRPQNEQKED